MGFTDEGTPVFSDTKDTVRILNGQLWTPFCALRELLTGPSDHFWVVGVSETAQNIRAIKCKGAKYPAALPRPTLMILDAKVHFYF
jgi:chromosome transmission fidelity protein 4